MVASHRHDRHATAHTVHGVKPQRPAAVSRTLHHISAEEPERRVRAASRHLAEAECGTVVILHVADEHEVQPPARLGHRERAPRRPHRPVDQAVAVTPPRLKSAEPGAEVGGTAPAADDLLPLGGYVPGHAAALLTHQHLPRAGIAAAPPRHPDGIERIVIRGQHHAVLHRTRHERRLWHVAKPSLPPRDHPHRHGCGEQQRGKPCQTFPSVHNRKPPIINLPQSCGTTLWKS